MQFTSKVVKFGCVGLLLTSLVLFGWGCDKKPAQVEPEKPLFSNYSNTKHGYGLEHPSNWYKIGDAGSDVVQLGSEGEEVVGGEVADGGAPLGVRVEIIVSENPENLYIEKWIDKMIWGYYEEETTSAPGGREKIALDGMTAIKETYIPISGPIETGAPISVYIARGLKIIQINYLGRQPDYDENLGVFQGLLDSFKLEAKPVPEGYEQMFGTAREYIAKYSVEGMETGLEVIKELDEWVLLRMIPLNIETDIASIILEKENGKWVARQFGTILPGWKEKVPELFE